MEFRLAFNPKVFSTTIHHSDNLLLVGSCFTENIGTKLKQAKFDVLENPNGILFNPISIVKSVNSYIQNRQYTADDLFYNNESWHSWEHHSRFSHPDKQQCLEMINQSQAAAHAFLKTADWILITVGSAFVYNLVEGKTPLLISKGAVLSGETSVANCHKIPTDKFNKKLLNAAEVRDAFQLMISNITAFNPVAKIIFTISPVRHLREGFVENNRSKAVLIQAIHNLVESCEKLFYFPAYELVIDDLRDYRFFAEDMVHPNYTATNYVWEKFVFTCIDEPSQQLMKELYIINAARNHKPFNPASEAHKKFLQVNLQKVLALKAQHSYLQLEDEIEFFGIS